MNATNQHNTDSSVKHAKLSHRWAFVAALSMASSFWIGVAIAGIPEPDVILWGEIRLVDKLTSQRRLITAADDVTVIARVDEALDPVGQYDMADCNGNRQSNACDIACGIGCDPNNCGNSTDDDSNGIPDECSIDKFIIRARLESGDDGSQQGLNVARVGQTIRIFVREGTNGPEQIVGTYTIQGRGSLQRLDLLPGYGDLTGDGAVDLTDYSSFAQCISGAGNTSPPPACTQKQFTASDSDGDGDVDLNDVAVFTTRFSPQN